VNFLKALLRGVAHNVIYWIHDLRQWIGVGRSPSLSYTTLETHEIISHASSTSTFVRFCKSYDKLPIFLLFARLLSLMNHLSLVIAWRDKKNKWILISFFSFEPIPAVVAAKRN